jgi:squalene-associated FAD-dependent desaturase
MGGGLAGLAAACSLADACLRVTLVEKRPFLGGRACSFVDPETGAEVDNGQHVFLGCCTAYIAFLRRLGVFHKTRLQRRLRLEVLAPSGRRGVIAASSWLPAPLSLVPALLAYSQLGLREKARLLAAMVHLARTNRAKERERLEGMTFMEWLRAQGQGERAVRRFWDLVVLPTLNDGSENVSAYMAFMVFQEALLRGRNGASIGYSRVGLTSLTAGAAREYVASRGGRVLLDRAALKVQVSGSRASGVELSGGEVLEADAVVSAVPWHVIPGILPPEWATHPFFTTAQGLEASPIVNIHVWYDRPVMEQELVAVVDSPLQFVFSKTRMQGLSGPGQYLSLSLSGAARWAAMPKEALREVFLPELACLFPRARDARVERFLVVKELRATFRSVPGAEAHRLPQATPVEGLFLAGDWTQTGWPATMESAVRSGWLAADQVLRRLGRAAAWRGDGWAPTAWAMPPSPPERVER